MLINSNKLCINIVLVCVSSGVIQVVGGMSIDLPSIHSIAVVSNTTAKSEFEIKMKLDIDSNGFKLDIAKPDEELDFIHIQYGKIVLIILFFH